MINNRNAGCIDGLLFILTKKASTDFYDNLSLPGRSKASYCIVMPGMFWCSVTATIK